MHNQTVRLKPTKRKKKKEKLERKNGLRQRKKSQLYKLINGDDS